MTNCDQVIALSLQHFDKLKATLKPNQNEYSSFSSIVSHKTLPNGEDEYQLISLALGTRSIAGEKAKLNNLIVDMHAESINRRAFKYYLAKRASHSLNGLKADLERTDFHLVISQLPCGIVNRYRGSDNSIRKKPGRGEVSKKATCFDKLAKWTLLGLQGRKLFAILNRPIRFKSIIIGNCSLELSEQDKQTFRQGMAFDLGAVAISESLMKEARRSDQHETIEETAEGPKRKKLKPSDTKDDLSNESEVIEEEDPLEENHSKEEKHGGDTESPTSPFELIAPKIHFSDTFVNELFVRREGKKPQDKSVVCFLEPNEEPKEDLKEQPKEEPKEQGKLSKEVVVSADTLTDRQEGVPSRSDNQETNKVDGNSIANNERSVGKRKHKEEYRVECIQDGRKLGSTKKNYERLLLTLSPSSLSGLITSALEKNEIDLAKNKNIEAYDSAWNRLREQCPNFVRWTDCEKT